MRLIAADKLIEEIDSEENRRADALQADRYIDMVKRQPKLSLETKTSDWIPCSERLPEVCGEYLCCNTWGYMIIGFPYECDISETGFSAEGVDTLYDVVAWQPLPEPYRGTNDGKTYAKFRILAVDLSQG